MTRKTWLWLSALAMLAVLVAYQVVVTSAGDRDRVFGGHNGCDTRDDILNRDLVDKTTVWTKRCPDAVETGTLHDPYTRATINFHRGAKVGEAVQIDHVLSATLTWSRDSCSGVCVDDIPLTVIGD